MKCYIQRSIDKDGHSKSDFLKYMTHCISEHENFIKQLENEFKAL